MNGLMLNIIIFFTALEIISGDSDSPRNRNRAAPKSVRYYPDDDPLFPPLPDYEPGYYPRRFFPLYYYYPHSPYYYGRYPYSPYYGRYPYSPYYPYFYGRYFYPSFYGPGFRRGRHGYGYLSYVSPKRSK
uniref:Uncharacterized protein n=1 Tax=Onchocerca volvulus TaxID=6282 RepID=A0A158N7T4_ONCVO